MILDTVLIKGGHLREQIGQAFVQECTLQGCVAITMSRSFQTAQQLFFCHFTPTYDSASLAQDKYSYGEPLCPLADVGVRPSCKRIPAE